ncbi:MAG: hypothetical protein ACR2GL_00810 [Thermoleophilaceae bacterium]
MSRHLPPLASVALVVIGAALIAALAGSTPPTPTPTETDTGTVPEREQPSRRASVDPVTDAARRYALAARNWTPATYRASWERQIALAGGGYRRALIAQRPGPRELLPLRKDRARSNARVLHAERDGSVRAPAARVLVTLREITRAGGQVIGGATLNEVRLRRRGTRWEVIGWTVLPGS